VRLQDEIAALREEIAASSGRSATTGGPSPQDDRSERGGREVETLLEEVNAMLDDFSEELDRHPRLAALAALGVGLVLGAALGRRLR